MSWTQFDANGNIKEIGPAGPTGATGLIGNTGPPLFIDEGLPGEDGRPGLNAAAIEYGTWTPVIGGAGGTSGQTYTAQSGQYCRFILPVGSIVLFTFRAELSNKGTITGNLQISGLPYAMTTANTNSPVSMGFAVLNANKVFVTGLITSGSQVISVRGLAAAAANLSVFTTSDVANTTVLSGSGLYFTD